MECYCLRMAQSLCMTAPPWNGIPSAFAAASDTLFRRRAFSLISRLRKTSPSFPLWKNGIPPASPPALTKCSSLSASIFANSPAATPPILLMDEPFGALDPVTRAEIQREFSALAHRLGKTIVFVTHDLREALLLASRIVLLEAGRIIASAAPLEFLRLDHPEVRAFASSLAITPGAPV